MLRIQHKLLFITVILALIAAGCKLTVIPPKDLVCPVKTQNCQQNMWKGLIIDTSRAYRDVADWYYTIEPLRGINSPEDEWALSFINNKKAVLTFSDMDMNRVMMLKLPREDRAVMESGIGVPVDGNLGAFSIKKDNVLLAVSSNDVVLGNSDIYRAVLNDNLVSDPEVLSTKIHDNILTWESHPAQSPNGNVIFFASDRQLGTGEIDLWFTVRIPGEGWSEPINCGENINSSCDELTPFITNDGKTLLFASSGFESLGGYDLFHSEISNEFWILAEQGKINELKNATNFFTPAKNMRAPINTRSDELFPSTPDNYDDLLYYSSNQAETKNRSILSKRGGFDLYVMKKVKKYIANKDNEIIKNPEFDLDIDIVDNTEYDFSLNFNNFLFRGQIFNARTNQPAKNGEIIIKEIKTKSPSFVEKVFKDTTGKYIITEIVKDKEYLVTTQDIELEKETFVIRKDKDTVIYIKADADGKYNVELEKDREFEITAQAQDLFFESFKLRVENEDTTAKIVYEFKIPEKLELRVNFPSGVYDEPYKYTLDSNGIEINRTWQEEMDLLAKNIISQIGSFRKVIFTGHTDEVGSESSNMVLGQQRVDFVVAELQRRGVPADLLEARSAGESLPLKRKKGENNDTYWKRCRRVDIQKI